MPDYFEFEVELAGVKPRIWRRFLVPKCATFLDLHQAIQDAGGGLVARLDIRLVVRDDVEEVVGAEPFQGCPSFLTRPGPPPGHAGPQPEQRPTSLRLPVRTGASRLSAADPKNLAHSRFLGQDTSLNTEPDAMRIVA